jgi:hypothetical protein
MGERLDPDNQSHTWVEDPYGGYGVQQIQTSGQGTSESYEPAYERYSTEVLGEHGTHFLHEYSGSQNMIFDLTDTNDSRNCPTQPAIAPFQTSMADVVRETQYDGEHDDAHLELGPTPSNSQSVAPCDYTCDNRQGPIDDVSRVQTESVPSPPSINHSSPWQMNLTNCDALLTGYMRSAEAMFSDPWNHLRVSCGTLVECDRPLFHGSEASSQVRSEPVYSYGAVSSGSIEPAWTADTSYRFKDPEIADNTNMSQHLLTPTNPDQTSRRGSHASGKSVPCSSYPKILRNPPLATNGYKICCGADPYRRYVER